MVDRRVVNGAVWIVCGFLVITIRVFFVQTTSLFLWEVLSGLMIVYGASRVAWALLRSVPDAQPVAP